MMGDKPLAAAAKRLQGKPGRPRKGKVKSERPAIDPRLLGLRASGWYLGDLSTWTVRDLEAKGILKRVRIPLPNGGELRKLLFDRADLDRLIDEWKDQGSRQ